MAFFHGVDPVAMMRGERVAASHFCGGTDRLAVARLMGSLMLSRTTD